MRYTVGKDYLFISQVFTSVYEDGRIFHHGSGRDLFVPWLDKNLCNVIRLMKCIEHHKVEVEYSKELGDGFVFQDEYGDIWYNQYPKAYYDQIDDRQDYLIHLRDASIMCSWMKDGLYFLSNLEKGILDMTKSKDLDNAAMLKKMFDETKMEMEKVSGKKIISQPIVWHHTDGNLSVSHDDIRHCVFEEDSETAEIDKQANQKY